MTCSSTWRSSSRIAVRAELFLAGVVGAVRVLEQRLLEELGVDLVAAADLLLDVLDR